MGTMKRDLLHGVLIGSPAEADPEAGRILRETTTAYLNSLRMVLPEVPLDSPKRRLAQDTVVMAGAMQALVVALILTTRGDPESPFSPENQKGPADEAGLDAFKQAQSCVASAVGHGLALLNDEYMQPLGAMPAIVLGAFKSAFEGLRCYGIKHGIEPGQDTPESKVLTDLLGFVSQTLEDVPTGKP